MIDKKLNNKIVESMELHMKIYAQESYCLNNCYPFFAIINICPYCKKRIWDNIELEECQSKLITGCPSCGHSFC